MKRYRLTENRLRQIIRESVKSMINEGFEMPLYNDYGEPLDTGGYYDDDDYIDSIDDYEYDRETSRCGYLINDIMNGQYDNRLDDILKMGVGIYFDISPDYDSYDDVEHAVQDRKCIIDKEYAFKRGKRSDGLKGYVPDTDSTHKLYGNFNVRDFPNRHREKIKYNTDDYWNPGRNNESINRRVNRIVKESIRRNLH